MHFGWLEALEIKVDNVDVAGIKSQHGKTGNNVGDGAHWQHFVINANDDSDSLCQFPRT